MEVLTAFLGWCSVVNIGVLLVTTIILIWMKAPIIGFHARLFDVEREKLSYLYLQYLAHYKIAILVFNLVPYLVLKIMAG